MVSGVIRGLGRDYKRGREKGLECLEIRVDNKDSKGLPIRENDGIPIQLKIESEYFGAILRHTTRNPYVWISPDMSDERTKEYIKLAYVLKNHGYHKNQVVNLEVHGRSISIRSIQ